VAATTKTAAVAMATATASDDGNGNGDGDGGGCLGVFLINLSLRRPTAKSSVFDDVRYGKVRYIGALRTAHYALRPP